LKSNFDIFHPTYFDDYFLKYLNEKPFVLTIHDLTHEIFSKKFDKYNDHNLLNNRRLLIDKTSKIIAISENTKKKYFRYLLNR